MIYILGIETSCDDTSAAITEDSKILANVIANQDIHKEFGGVVPELASRAHQQNIIPVINKCFNISGISKDQINAVAFTRGPGLLGSLLVGVSFAKAFALARQIPLIEVDHLNAHIFSNNICQKNSEVSLPELPFLSLIVSGGHTQIVLVKNYFETEIIGDTIDDAAGEAFDKAAKILGLEYPGGPIIDKFAKTGKSNIFKLSKPNIKGLNFSFSGLKTSFLYLIRDELKKNPGFIDENINDLCASLQNTIIEILVNKLLKASLKTGIKEITISGGVSANSALRKKLSEVKDKYNWNIFIPEPGYSTDNAAMVATCGYYKYLNNDFCEQSITPYSRSDI